MRRVFNISAVVSASRLKIDVSSILVSSWLRLGSQIDTFWHRFAVSQKASKKILTSAATMLLACCARTEKGGSEGGVPLAKSLAQAKLFRSEERRAIVRDLTRLWAVGPANFCFFSYMSCKHVLQLCGSFVSKAQHRFHQSLVIT